MLGVEVSGHELAALVAELVPDAVSELDVPRQVLVGDLYGAHRAPLLRHQAVPACNISGQGARFYTATSMQHLIYLSIYILARRKCVYMFEVFSYLNVRLSNTSSKT